MAWTDKQWGAPRVCARGHKEGEGEHAGAREGETAWEGQHTKIGLSFSVREFTKKGKPSSESDNVREDDGVGNVDALGRWQGTRLIGGHREEHGGEGGWRVMPLCLVALSRHPEVASEREQWSYSC